MRLSTLRAQALSSAIVVVLLVVLGAVVIGINESSLRAAHHESDLERQIQVDSSAFLAGMLNQETGVRGYTDTGQSQFLDPYSLGQGQIIQAERQLGGEVTGDASFLLRREVEAADAWQVWAGSRVNAVTLKGGPIIDASESAIGKNLFDDFRTRLASFDTEVAKGLATAQARADAQSNTVLATTVINAALIVLVIVLLGLAVTRSTLRPLGRLLDSASALAAGRPAEIVDRQSQNEVGRLASALAAWKRIEVERLTLVKTANELNSLVDRDQILELGAQRLREVLDCPYVTISVPDPGGLRLLLSPGLEAEPSQVTPIDSPSARALRTRRPVITDLRGTGWSEVIIKWRDEHAGGPTLAVPLISRGDAIGVVTCVRRDDQGDFTDADKDRAELMAPSLASAIRVGSLFDDLKRTAAELELANRHKSIFLANMSHELRTPLNAILGFSELMIDDTTGDIDAATRLRFLGQVHSSGKHLLGLINDVLDLSKVEAGQMKLNVARTHLSEIVKSMLMIAEPLAAKKHIRLNTDAVQDLELLADEAKVLQMLLNLVSNAIKFTPTGGLVTMAARKSEAEVSIDVSDTGIGMSAEDLARIFQEFQQVDSGPDRQQEGTGLGLALTKRFAELHGGSVSVQSAKGAGSTFTLHLPVAAGFEAPDEAGQSHDASTDMTRPLVLVVEDNPQAAELLARHLERGGFRMAIARTGAEALAKARELKPVAITLDILLPEIDGWEVLSRLKQDDAIRNIPVVVVSVIDNPRLGRALGALDYFVKPVDRDALLSRLSRYTFTSKVKRDEVRILVVDDEVANRELLDAALKGAGFSVLQASGGKEGIDLARAHLPDLMLLDLMMPEVSGFDVVEALRADATTRSIPIMVLTAKVLTDEDRLQLNGQVAAVFERNSIAGPELVGWLNQLTAGRPDG